MYATQANGKLICVRDVIAPQNVDTYIHMYMYG